MKQLRVQVDDYNATGGLLQINFNEPIKVVPGSEISFDKFQMTVTDGLTNNFELPNQIIGIDTNILDSQIPERFATVPAGSYVNIGDLLSQLNISLNSILNTDMLNPLSTPDNGLFFRTWIDSTSGLVDIGFGSAGIDYTIANIASTANSNMGFTPGTPTVWKARAAGAYSLITSVPIMCGGVDIRLGLDLVSNTVGNVFDYGLYAGGEIVFGIRKTGTNFFAIDNGEVYTIGSSVFVNHPNYKHQFYVRTGGKLCYQVTTATDEQIFNFVFTGYSVNDTYNFAIENGFWDGIATVAQFTDLGIIYQTNIVPNTFGWLWDYASFKSPDYLQFFELGVNAGAQPPPRIIQFDFSAAQTLQTGLGYVATIFNIGSNNGVTSAAIGADDPFGFLDFYDLALQVPSLQLESYIASGDRRLGSRVNNLAYFVPTQAGGTTSTIYTFDTKELIFVGISNKETENMNSMQFRVIYANNPSAFVKCSQMSFNIYIKEPKSL